MITGLNAQESMRLWGALMKHPAWQELEKLCDEHVTALAGTALQTIRNEEELALHNAAAGQIQGVHHVLGLPKTMVELAQVEIGRNPESRDAEDA
jgi:hypothetical protein